MGYSENVMQKGLKHRQELSDMMFTLVKLLHEYAISGVERDTLPYIHTFYGTKFRHLSPRVEDVFIEDIAHGLSRICRYTGHVNAEMYSVAEHSVRVSYACSPEDAFAGLMHDASETYCNDLARPVKRLPGVEGYRYYEKLIQKVIEEKFNLPDEPESVQIADRRMMATEKRDLYWRDSSWAVNTGEEAVPYPDKIEPWSSTEAERRFLMRFYELSGERRFYEKYKVAEVKPADVLIYQ